MTRASNRPSPEPTPGQLAAYFDGELVGSVRAAVESWLARHPEALANHDDELARVWQRTQPADPGPASWAGVLDRIGSELP